MFSSAYLPEPTSVYHGEVPMSGSGKTALSSSRFITLTSQPNFLLQASLFWRRLTQFLAHQKMKVNMELCLEKVGQVMKMVRVSQNFFKLFLTTC